MTFFTNRFNDQTRGFSAGTNTVKHTPQPGSVSIDDSSAALTVLDVGNMEDVLAYLGINPEL